MSKTLRKKQQLFLRPLETQTARQHTNTFRQNLQLRANHQTAFVRAWSNTWMSSILSSIRSEHLLNWLTTNRPDVIPFIDQRWPAFAQPAVRNSTSLTSRRRCSSWKDKAKTNRKKFKVLTQLLIWVRRLKVLASCFIKSRNLLFTN